MALPRANGSSYDVFLSFRGEDTRHSFTDHLYAALKQAGIKAFRDSDDAERGEELKQEIHGAIETSDASIIVLSENYATSTWCLDELSLILDRRRDSQHFVLPVFYKVDPSDVGQQKGTFFIEPNLNSSSRRWTDDNVNRWKAALTEVVGIIGMSLVGSETEFLKKVVGTIYNRLDRKQIYIPPNLTGMDAREKEIKSWINQSESKFLLIYGMAGSGKSTLAQYIVYSNFQSFESVSIVEHIGRKCKEPHDMVKLQEQLCKDMLRGKDRRIPSVCQGTPTIEVLLEQKKALIVLDDIVKESQLEDLLGSGNINKESKIIVTTDNDVSNWFKLKSWRCEEYKMKLLDDEESLELLSLHAFRSKTPMDGFKELAKQVVEYCEGSPLALKVLGSSLSKDNSIRSWESALKLFGKDFHSDIYGVLKRSYDSLPYDSDKELFLHIACFFVGKDMDYIVKILEPEYSAESKIKTLMKRCFLYVTPNKQLMMHRLLQDMGKSLVDRESRKLAARSRLWRNKDSYDMLRRGKSSDLLKGLTLDMQMLMEENEFNSKQLKESPLTTDSLQRMDQLKLLQLNYVKLTGSYKDSSHHLLWLCWFGYNESIIDSDIFMGNMVALDLSYSCLKEFEPPTVLQSLKILNFKDSRSLLEIRNIHLIPNLETLILWNCHCLLRVCKTIENLEKLALLNMTGCENLYDKKQLNSLVELKASTSGGESTQELSFPLPLSLQRLFLNNCKLECTDYFPLSFSDQSSLQYLNLGNSLFEELPCYVHLKNLRVLDLSLCSRLISLLCLPSTLAELYVCYCKSIEKITFESGRFTLQEFGYEGCINLSEIEGLLKLVLIAKLDETDLGHMMWLKEYENHDVFLVGDDGLTKDRSCHLQMLYEFDIMSTSLPDIKHPNLTPEYASQYTCLSFDVPLCPKSRSLKGLDVTFRYRISGEDWAWFCKISVTGVDDLIYNPKVFGKPASGKVGIWLSYWPIGNSLVVGDEVKVSIIVMRGLEVLECGARLVYTDDDVTGEILENKMGWVETLGGDLSGFQLTTGAYYLCRRDFFEQMEVGKINPSWFSILVGDYIDSTVVRGWRMTGRPQQLYQSFTELKTVRCIMYEPETEKIYKISEMSESSFVDETTMATSTILRDTMESGTRSEFSDSATKAMDISRARVINKTMKLKSSSLDEDEEEEKGELDGIKERISSIQEKIMAWEGDDEAMIWDCDPEEAKKYVKTVDEACRLAERLESLNLSKDDGGLLRNVNTVIQTSMARIEEEFRHMLVNNRQNIGPESFSFHSCGDSVDEHSIFSTEDDSVDDSTQSGAEVVDDSTQSGAEVFIMDLVNPRVIPDLKCIANLMFDSNYGQECSQAFISARKDALDDCLFILEVEKLSIEDVSKMEWVALKSKIRRWTKAMRIFVRVYLASEKFLCEQIFGETEPVSSICFSESSKTSMLLFLNFAEAIAVGPHPPQKLLRILDMYELLSDLMPDIEDLYSEESGSYIRIECQDVLTRVGDCVKATFIEFENAVGSNTSNSAFPGGGIHHLTRYVMNYIRTLTDYHDSLNACLKDQDRVADGQDSSTPLDASPGNDDDNNNSSSSPMVMHFRSLMSILECNLEEKSKLYKDEALGHLFMMNNIHYMAEKVKNSELRNFLGDDWIRKCNRNFQQYAMNYERATWSSILNLLKEDGPSNSGSSGSTSRTLLRERLRAFYAAFEEIYKNQTGWTVPNTQMRKQLRISVSTKVIQAYRTFIAGYSYFISEYIKYTADDLENYIMDLFEGTPKSFRNSRK